MINRQTYETLLKTLCEAYRVILKLFERVNEYDSIIIELAKECKTNSGYVCTVISQKEQLIAQIEKVSVCIEQMHAELDGIIALHNEVCCHPMYQHMEDLQKLTFYRMDTLLNKEDVNNPQVINNLTECKESFELDKKISEVPAEKRQIFMLVPEKEH